MVSGRPPGGYRWLSTGPLWPLQRPPGHAIRGDKAAPPGRDAVHMVCGHSGPELMTHHANGSLGTCNAFILVGHSYKNVTRPRLYRKHLYQENIIFQILDNTLAKINEIRSSQEGVAIEPLSQLPSTSHIYIPSKQNRPKQQHNPDEARLCKGAFGLQKLCQVPDGDEGARMHRAQLIFHSRQGPAMELLGLAQGCGWATPGCMPWRDGPCAVIRSW